MSAAGGTGRTWQPVRRESLDVDDPRADVFRPIEGGLRFVDAYLDAFSEWANVTKKSGAAHELTQNCRRVLEVLLRNCTDFKTGICEPCLDTLQKKTRFARPTIVRALKVLKHNKWLDWVRRTAKTGNAPGEGPAVRQVSNAYYYDLGALPARVKAWLAAKMRKSGKPIEIPREPRRPIFAGRWKRSRDRRRGELAARLRDAGPAEQAALLYPGDPESQRTHLAMLGEGASSGHGLNPSCSIEGKAE